MRSRSDVGASVFVLLVAAATAASCGGGSDSEVASGGGSGRGGSDAGKGGSAAGRGGNSGAGKGGGGHAGDEGDAGHPSAGANDAGEGGRDPGAAGGAATDCEPRTSWTEAVHYVLSVTWPGTTASESGEGEIHLWSRVQYTADGEALELALHACGSMLPETNLTAAGRIATGGEKVLIEVEDSVWDSPSFPATTTSGTHTGFGVGSSIVVSYVSELGVRLSDSSAEWPDSVDDLDVFDVEMDGADGYTATPREGDGYVLPPTALGIVGSAPAADKVYLVSRQAVTLSGARTTCDAHAGTAEVAAFDNHVVGCHISGGEDCTANQSDFVDQNRMRYAVSSARYEAEVVADDANCAEIRAALPPQ